MKAHQKIVREQNAAAKSETDLELKKLVALSFEYATVQELSLDAAKPFILKNEYLGNMGSPVYAFGLFFGPYFAGAAIFGNTLGSKVYAAICGADHAGKAITLIRGACEHWAHPHSASWLINRACEAMVAKGFNVFIAYSDPDAGEIGTVYQASNWLYVGPGGGPQMGINAKTGKRYDFCGAVRALARKGGRIGRPERRRGATIAEVDTWAARYAAKTGKPIKGKGHYKYVELVTQAEAAKILRARDGEPTAGSKKGRYIRFAGDKRTVRTLRKALKLKVLPYPKRDAD